MPPEDDDRTKTDDKTTGGDDGGEVARMRAALAKANAEAKKFREEADALKASIAEGKTDAERVAGTLAELKARADAADLRAMRAEVAASKGLTSAQAKRLQGTTVEELEADADELLAAFKPTETDGSTDNGATARKTGVGRPQEALRPGATPPAEQTPAYDSAKLLADVPRG